MQKRDFLKTEQFRAMVSITYDTYGLFKEPTIGRLKSKMAEIRHLDVIYFSAEGGAIWIKFRRLVQNDMSTAKPQVEFQYGGRLGELCGRLSQRHVSHCRMLPPGEFNDMLSQSHVPYCRVLPLCEFNDMISEPHATLQGAVTRRI